MCAVGTLNTSPFGFPALLVKILVFFAASTWLILPPPPPGHARLRPPHPPEIRPVARHRAPMVLIEAYLQIRFFLALDTDVITSCCGSLFGTNREALGSSSPACRRPWRWPCSTVPSASPLAAAWRRAVRPGPATPMASSSALSFRLPRGHRLVRLALRVRAPPPPLPVLPAQGRVRLPGLPALRALVPRDGARDREWCRRLRRCAQLARPGPAAGAPAHQCLAGRVLFLVLWVCPRAVVGPGPPGQRGSMSDPSCADDRPLGLAGTPALLATLLSLGCGPQAGQPQTVIPPPASRSCAWTEAGRASQTTTAGGSSPCGSGPTPARFLQG